MFRSVEGLVEARKLAETIVEAGTEDKLSVTAQKGNALNYESPTPRPANINRKDNNNNINDLATISEASGGNLLIPEVGY
jgi:hypothetical protein